MAKQRKAYTREERKHMVVQAFLVEETKQGMLWGMTTADIARYLKVTASTKLRDILTEMVIEGTLLEEREKSVTIKGYTRIFHLSTKKHNEVKPPEPKHHALRINGHKSGHVVTQEVLL